MKKAGRTKKALSITLLLVILISSIIIVLISLPGLLPTRWLEKRVEKSLRQAFANQVSLTHISVTWRGHIRIHDLLLHKEETPSSRPLLKTKIVDLNIKIIPLLKKELIIEDLTLIDPEINITYQKNGSSPQKLFAKPPLFFVSKFSLKNGSFTYKDLSSGKSVTLKKIFLRAECENLNRPFHYKASFLWIDRDNPAKIRTRGSIKVFHEGKPDIENLEAECTLIFDELDIPPQITGYLAGLPKTDLKKIKGSMTITRDASKNIRSKGQLDISRLTLIMKKGLKEGRETVITEPHVDFDLSYHHSDKKVTIKNLKIKRESSASIVTGTLQEIFTNPFLDLSLDIEKENLFGVDSSLTLQGKVFSKNKITGHPDNLFIKGDADLSQAEFLYRKNTLKKTDEEATLHYQLKAKEDDLIIEEMLLRLDSFTAKAGGEVLDYPQKRGIDLYLLIEGDSGKVFDTVFGKSKVFALSGSVKNSSTVRGTLEDMQIKGNMTLDDTRIAHEGNTIKPPEKELRITYETRIADNVLSISKIGIAFPKDILFLTGEMTPSSKRIVFERTRLSSQKHPSEILIDGTLAYSPERISMDHMSLSVKESRLALSTVIQNYLSRPKILFELTGEDVYLNDMGRFLLIPWPAFSSQKQGPEKVTETSDYVLNSAIKGKISIHTLYAGNFPFRNVNGRIDLNDKTCFVEELNFNVNGGTVQINGSVDMKQENPQFTLHLDMKNINANKNLRTILDVIFPRLFILKKFDGTVSLTALGSTQEEILSSLHGRSRITITEGYIKGNPVPSYTAVLFPFLNSPTYTFKKGDIATGIRKGVMNNIMTFTGGNFDFYINGATDPIKREVDYTFGVDLLSSTYLSIFRPVIPKKISKRIKVDIAHIKGKQKKPEFQYLKPESGQPAP